MAGQHTPKTGLAEALFVIFLTFFGELLGILVPFIGSLVFVLICQVYVFLRGLPYVASLVAGAIDVVSSSWLFAQTVGMIVVFVSDHNPKLGKIAEKVSSATIKGAAAKGARQAAVKSAAKKGPDSRREKWFTERNRVADQKAELASAGEAYKGLNDDQLLLGGNTHSIQRHINSPLEKILGQNASARRSQGTPNSGQTYPQSADSEPKEQEDSLVQEIFEDPVEKMLREKLEHGLTMKDIREDWRNPEKKHGSSRKKMEIMVVSNKEIGDKAAAKSR